MEDVRCSTDQNAHNKKVAGQVGCEQLSHSVVPLFKQKNALKLSSRCEKVCHVGF